MRIALNSFHLQRGAPGGPALGGRWSPRRRGAVLPAERRELRRGAGGARAHAAPAEPAPAAAQALAAGFLSGLRYVWGAPALATCSSCFGVVSGPGRQLQPADAGVREDGPRHQRFRLRAPPYGGGVARSPPRSSCGAPYSRGAAPPTLSSASSPSRSPCSASGRAAGGPGSSARCSRATHGALPRHHEHRSSSWCSRTATAGG